MPIYQYKCSECDEVNDYLVETDQTPDECRSCDAGIQDFVFFERVYNKEVPAKGKSSNTDSLGDCENCGFPYEMHIRPDDN